MTATGHTWRDLRAVPDAGAIVDAAMAYAEAGLPVFPCVPHGKAPAIAFAKARQRSAAA